MLSWRLSVDPRCRLVLIPYKEYGSWSARLCCCCLVFIIRTFFLFHIQDFKCLNKTKNSNQEKQERVWTKSEIVYCSLWTSVQQVVANLSFGIYQSKPQRINCWNFGGESRWRKRILLKRFEKQAAPTKALQWQDLSKPGRPKTLTARQICRLTGLTHAPCRYHSLRCWTREFVFFVYQKIIFPLLLVFTCES